VADYSSFLSSFGQQSNPIIPQFGQDVMGLGDSMGSLGVPQLGGGGGIADALAAYSANAGKLTTKDMINTGLTGVQTLGGLIGAFGSYGLAKKNYNLQKRAMETNLTNSVGAYNTALEDKARSRAVVEGQSDAERDAYVTAHRATTGR
jgi:hypothetical protein